MSAKLSVCTFLFSYLRGKKTEKYQKKKETRNGIEQPSAEIKKAGKPAH